MNRWERWRWELGAIVQETLCIKRIVEMVYNTKWQPNDPTNTAVDWLLTTRREHPRELARMILGPDAMSRDVTYLAQKLNTVYLRRKGE